MNRTSIHRFAGKDGYEAVITSENSRLQYLGFSRILIKPGGKFEYEVMGCEMAIVLQEGDFTASVEWKGEKVYENISGSRKDVFEELPTAIYLPPGSKIKMESQNGMEARVFTAVCAEGNPPYFCEPKDVEEGSPGENIWKRKYRFIFGPLGKHNGNVTKLLIVGESISVPGGWIGFPAHRHDYDNEKEYPLEEIFSFKVKGPKGAYLIQHSYGLDEQWNEFFVINDDNCAIALPEGYHTSFAVPTCTEYLFWGLAGDKKVYKVQFDERFLEACGSY